MAKRPRKSDPGRDDAALWEAVKATATPVVRDTVFRDSLAGSTDAVPPLKPKAKAKKATARAPGRVPDADLPAPKPLPARALGHGCAPGVDKRTAERLKKGRMDIQGRLDLHGMSRDAAHRATIDFVTGARMAGKRCVLIVTGKGKGILQADLPHWLNLPPVRQHILSFSHARPQDGGTGAVYVLLKRDRGA